MIPSASAYELTAPVAMVLAVQHPHTFFSVARLGRREGLAQPSVLASFTFLSKRIFKVSRKFGCEL